MKLKVTEAAARPDSPQNDRSVERRWAANGEAAAPADLELRILLRFTRSLPRARGAVRLAALARRIYLRKRRPPVVAEVAGFTMKLDPADWVQGGVLFWPQLWDYREFQFLSRNLRKGDTFLDIGAHVGFNSLIASRVVGPDGFVLAVEAAPDLFDKLRGNLEINQVMNVRAVNRAVSDRDGVMMLSRPMPENSAGRSLLPGDREGTPVQCAPLAELVREFGVTRISGAWLEIAGAEFMVLNRYFQECPQALWPGFLMVEDNPGWAPQAGGDVFALLRDRGYTEERIQAAPSDQIRNRAFIRLRR